jgi:hypothetical protein
MSKVNNEIIEEVHFWLKYLHLDIWKWAQERPSSKRNFPLLKVGVSSNESLSLG